jgi:pimeloyl-ACP methyl ester carboxylesterase
MKVVYLHGLGGSPRDWDQVMRLVPGEAPPIPSAPFTQLAGRFARDWSQRTEPFVVCGYSMGGRLALAAADQLTTPMFQGLVLLSAGFGFPTEEERQARRALDAGWAEKIREDLSAFWRDWYGQELFSSFRRLPEHRQNSWLKERLSIDIEHLAAQFREMGPAEHEYLEPALARLARRGISVLYIAGDQDKKYSDQARHLRGVPSEIIAGGHILPLENTAAVAESLRRFLGSVAKGK